MQKDTIVHAIHSVTLDPTNTNTTGHDRRHHRYDGQRRRPGCRRIPRHRSDRHDGGPDRQLHRCRGVLGHRVFLCAFARKEHGARRFIPTCRKHGRTIEDWNNPANEPAGDDTDADELAEQVDAAEQRCGTGYTPIGVVREGVKHPLHWFPYHVNVVRKSSEAATRISVPVPHTVVHNRKARKFNVPIAAISLWYGTKRLIRGPSCFRNQATGFELTFMTEPRLLGPAATRAIRQQLQGGAKPRIHDRWPPGLSRLYSGLNAYRKGGFMAIDAYEDTTGQGVLHRLPVHHPLIPTSLFLAPREYARTHRRSGGRGTNTGAPLLPRLANPGQIRWQRQPRN